MTKYDNEVEKRISEACRLAKDQEKPNIASLSRQFNVPYQQLRARLGGRSSLLSRSTTIKKTLDDYQEKALIRIQQLDSLYCPPTPLMIEHSANQILRRNFADNEPIHTVGKNWVYRFIKRLPEEFKLVKQKPKEKNRLKAEDIGPIQHWFDCLERFIEQIPPRNIYNSDETGFQLGQGKNQKVVTTRPEQAIRGHAAGEIGELVSAIECVSADGFTITPYFIFKGVYHLQGWYDSDIPGECENSVLLPFWMHWHGVQEPVDVFCAK